jgi:hypothetical protein
MMGEIAALALVTIGATAALACMFWGAELLADVIARRGQRR